MSTADLEHYADDGSFFIFYVQSTDRSGELFHYDLPVGTSAESQELAVQAVRMFTPIRSYQLGELTDPDFKIGFQSGKEPLIFQVRVQDSSLAFQIWNSPYVYTGGNVKKLEKVITEVQRLDRKFRLDSAP